MRFGLALIAAVAITSGIALAADDAGSQPSPEKLVEQLEASKDARLDVELKTGKSLLRCRFLSLTTDSKGRPRTIKVHDAERDRPVTLGFSAIRSLTIDREEVYRARESGKATGKQAIAAKQTAAAAEAEAKWLAKARENNAPIWEELTPEQHQAAIREHEAMIAKVQQMVSGMELYETHEFMFLSNMPREQVIPYAKSLDKMHDLMCNMYRIKPGTPIWRGKCLVVAFLQQAQFQAFEARFFQTQVSEGVYGICHQASTGRVVIACYRGDDPNDFGQMLVHETSHGFIARYRTKVTIPSWINEGMAEWIGQALVPGSTAVKRKEQLGLQLIRNTHSLNGLLTAAPIQGVHYGMASSLTSFLINTDKRKYADFIDGIKQGKTWETSLSDAYKATPEQLIGAYGRTIGVPDLKP